MPTLDISCNPRPLPPKMFLSGFGTGLAEPPKRTMFLEGFVMVVGLLGLMVSLIALEVVVVAEDW